jgi:hypothetical protein
MTLSGLMRMFGVHSLKHLGSTMSYSTRWVVEFDYAADPEVAPETVKAKLFETLSNTRGPFTYEYDYVTFDNPDDALWVRLHFDTNIVAIERA